MPEVIVLTGGRVVVDGGERRCDLLVDDGRIAAVEPRIDPPRGAKVIDVAGCVVGPALVDLHTIQTYEKQFQNLHIQETRLARRREKDIKELRAIQKDRLQKQDDLLANCAAMYRYAKTNNIAWEPAESGFEFSIPQIEHFLAMQNSKIGEMSLGKAA